MLRMNWLGTSEPSAHPRYRNSEPTDEPHPGERNLGNETWGLDVPRTLSTHLYAGFDNLKTVP